MNTNLLHTSHFCLYMEHYIYKSCFTYSILSGWMLGIQHPGLSQLNSGIESHLIPSVCQNIFSVSETFPNWIWCFDKGYNFSDMLIKNFEFFNIFLFFFFNLQFVNYWKYLNFTFQVQRVSVFKFVFSKQNAIANYMFYWSNLKTI